jgi:pectinesterase
MLLNRAKAPRGSRAAATAALLALAACSFCAGGVVGGGMIGSRSRQLVLLVDQSGKGDHRRIQDAIDAAPAASNSDGSAGGSVVIRIRPGVYRQVHI